MASSDVDVLYEVRTAFHLGHYQHCITEAQKIKVRVRRRTGGANHSMLPRPCLQPPTAAVAVERDVLMYRAYIAQVIRQRGGRNECSDCKYTFTVSSPPSPQRKYAVVIDEVRASSAPDLQAVKLLAQYMHSPQRRYSTHT